MASNTLIIAQGHDHPLLYSNGLYATQLHWISGQAPQSGFQCCAKTRYRQPDQECIIKNISDNDCEVAFTSPQRAVTPGQSVVFYDRDECLGGGIISNTNKEYEQNNYR